MAEVAPCPVPGPHLFRSPQSLRLADHKPDRPLTGPDTAALTDLVQADYCDYCSAPFIEDLNRLIGASPLFDLRKYVSARDRLFSTLIPERVSIVRALVVTQQRVNTARVEQLRSDPSRGAGKPVDMVLHGGLHYVVNGHHRLVGESLAGHESIRARVLLLG